MSERIMGRKLRKTQQRRHLETRRKAEGWYNGQRIKMRESPSHWEYMARLRQQREQQP